MTWLAAGGWFASGMVAGAALLALVELWAIWRFCAAIAKENAQRTSTARDVAARVMDRIHRNEGAVRAFTQAKRAH